MAMKRHFFGRCVFREHYLSHLLENVNLSKYITCIGGEYKYYEENCSSQPVTGYVYAAVVSKKIRIISGMERKYRLEFGVYTYYVSVATVTIYIKRFNYTL